MRTIVPRTLIMVFSLENVTQILSSLIAIDRTCLAIIASLDFLRFRKPRPPLRFIKSENMPTD